MPEVTVSQQSLVLVVTRRTELYRVLAHALEDSAYRLDYVAGTDEICKRSRAEFPDAVILDSELGFSAFDDIRSYAGDQTPILGIVDSLDSSLVDSVFSHGAHDVISLPIHDSTLLRRVGELDSIWVKHGAESSGR